MNVNHHSGFVAYENMLMRSVLKRLTEKNIDLLDRGGKGSLIHNEV